MVSRQWPAWVSPSIDLSARWQAIESLPFSYVQRERGFQLIWSHPRPRDIISGSAMFRRFLHVSMPNKLVSWAPADQTSQTDPAPRRLRADKHQRQ
jgi:hypothetical protein